VYNGPSRSERAIMEIEDIVNEVIASFDEDPASTEFQEGYLQAFLDLRDDYFPINKEM
jgi:hypothetical protein